MPGNGDGTFNASQALTFGIGDVSLGIGAADFGLDGRADLIVSNSEDNTVSVLSQIPGVMLSGASLAFGSQTVGTASVPQVLVVTNSGSATLAISGIAISGLKSPAVHSNQ